jgi:type IV secretion system protein TrbF
VRALLRRVAKGKEPGRDGTRPGATVARTAEPPWVAGRREFAGAFADLARGKRNWQLVAFGLLGLLAVVTLAYVRLASSSRIVPYVVQVDRLGQVEAVGPVEPMRTPEPRLVAAQLAEFIRHTRTVLPAAAARAQAEMLRRAYALADPAAAGFLNQYFSIPAHDPRLIGQARTREVAVTSVLPVPGSPAWRLRWTEVEHPLQAGGRADTSAWEGYLTVRLARPTTADVVQLNPLGVYVGAISWTKVADNSGGVP